MKRGRFTETQIISILKEADAGSKVKDICRRHGISDATWINTCDSTALACPCQTLRRFS